MLKSPCKILLRYCVFVVFTVGQVEAADNNGRADKRSCEQTDSETDAVDQAQDYLHEISCSAALWLDGVGGAKGSVDAARRTYGYLRLAVESSEFDGSDIELDGRIFAELPYLEKRTSAFIGRTPPRSKSTHRTDTFSTNNRLARRADEGEWLAGLGYQFPNIDGIETDVKVGVSGSSKPKLFVKSSASTTIHKSSSSLATFNGRPFWTNRDGFGITLDADYSLVVARGKVLRLAESATLSQKTGGVNWYVTTTLFQKLSYRRGLAWELYVAGESDEPEPLSVYGAQITYRTPVYKNKIQTQWNVKYEFPRVDPLLPRRRSVGIAIRFTLPFGTESGKQAVAEDS